MVRSQKKFRILDDEDLQKWAYQCEDPELSFLKNIYRAEFKQAFQDIFKQLTIRERNLLRFQILDKLNIDQLAGIYHVHRSTIARWLAKIRQHLFRETYLLLRERLQIEKSSLESIMRMIRSELSISIDRILKEHEKHV